MTNLAIKIDRDVLLRLVSSGRVNAQQSAIISKTAVLLPTLLAFAEITTPLRIAHFLAQLAHESDRFRTTEEYASGAAYEGRVDLGNTQPGDGKRHKGRGEIQLTGRDNYRNFTMWMRGIDPSAPDFVVNPDLAGEFPWAVWSAIWFWSTRNLNVLADRDDLIAVTKVINGGRNGLADRAALLGKAKIIIGQLAIGPQDVSVAEPILARGSSGEAVERLQRGLVSAGYKLGIDAQFGPATELVVRHYQAANGLTPDGVVGGATWLSLGWYVEGAAHG